MKHNRLTRRCVRAYIHTTVRYLRGFGAAPVIANEYPLLSRAGWDYVTRFSRQLHEMTRGRVYAGPFAEMILPRESHLADRPFWVLGCYEEEIHPAIADLIAAPPRMIVDVGSAHGFYMVGLATQIADIPIVGFEEVEEPHWREAAELAKANGVKDRITQKGRCDSTTLHEILKPHGAVLCDCEGGEIDILDPVAVPALKSCRIICELHEFFRPHVTATLVSRFRDSHDIQLICEQHREPTRYRLLNGFTDSQKRIAVSEPKFISGGVTASRYLWMRPKHG